MLEQGEDVYEDTGPEQGRHQSGPGSVPCHDIVDEDTERRGNHQGQQRQHEPAGDHAGEQLPGPAEQGAQLPEQIGPLATGLKIVAALESQRNAAIALFERFGGNPAPPRGRVVQIVVTAVVSFEDEEVAELPEQNQGQRQQAQLIRAYAEPVAFEPVVSGGAQDAGGAAAVPAHLAFIAQFGKRHPSSEVTQHDAQTGGAALGSMHLQQYRRGYPLDRPIRRGLVLRLSGGARRHLMAASSETARSASACRPR